MQKTLLKNVKKIKKVLTFKLRSDIISKRSRERAKATEKIFKQIG
jgi:hypothetical protein